MDGQEKTYAENVYAALKANLSPSEFSYANDEKGFYRRLEFDSTYADGVYQTLKNNLSKKDFQFMDNPNGFFEAIHFKKKAQSAPSSTGGTGSDSAAPSTTSGEVPVTPAPKQEKVNYTYQWGTQPATGSDAPQARSKEVIATEQNYNRLTETYADKPYTQADIEDIDFTQYRKEKAAKVNTTINNINAGMPVAAQQISERLNAETEAMPEIQAVKKQLNEAAQQKYNELVKKGVPTGQAKDAVTKEMATAFQNNPVVKEIYGKQTEKLKSEVEAWTKAQVKPETKYFSDKGLEGYKKMTDSDAFKSLSHDEQKTRLAQMWATIENRMRNTKKSQEVIDEAKHDFYYQMLEHVGVNENGTITPFAIKDFAINNLDAARKLEAQKAAEYDSWYNGVTDKTLATQTSLWNQKEDAKKAREILENIVAMPDNENGSLVKGVIDGGKIPFISSFLELNDGLRMYDIAKKQQRGEPLTEAQQGMLNNAALQQTYEAQSTPSTAYQIGKSLSESMAFMGELALTGGAYAVPQKAVAEGLSKVILKKTAQEAEKSAAYQFIIKPLSNVMGAATQTMANQPAILEKMVDRMQPGYIAAMSPEGDKVSATLDWSVQNQETGYNTQAGESFGQAYKQAAASTFSDILSENIFRALPAVMDPVKKRMLQTVTKNSELGKRLFIGWYMTKTGLGLDDVLKRLQARMIPIDGMVEEFAEEFINGSMTNLLTGDARILDGVLKDDNSVDWENIKVTAGSVALMQGLFGLAGKITPKKKVNIPVSDVNGNAHNLKMSANTASYIVQNAANKGYFELLQWAKQNVGRIKQEDREAAQALINGYLSELDSKRVKPFKEAPNVDPAWFKDLNNKYEEHLKNNPTTADDDATEGAGDAAHTVTQTDKPPTAVINIGGEMESVEGEEEIVARVNELKPQIITGEVEITFDNPTQVIKDAMTATPMTDEEVNAAAESLKVDESVTPVKYTEEEANKKLAEINASGKKPKGEELFNFLESLEEGAVVQHEGGDTRTVLGKKSIGKRGGESYELIPQILNEDTGEWEDNPSALTIVSKDKNGEFNVNAALTQDFSPNAYTEIKSGERKISYPKITYPKQTSGTTTAKSEVPVTSEAAEPLGEAATSETIEGWHTPTNDTNGSKIQSAGLPNGKFFSLDKPFGSTYHDASKAEKHTIDLKGKNIYNPDGVEGFPKTDEVHTEMAKHLNAAKPTDMGQGMTDFLKSKGYDGYVRLIDGQEGDRELIMFDYPQTAKPEAAKEGKTSNTSQNEKGNSKQAQGRQEGELLKKPSESENAGAVTPVSEKSAPISDKEVSDTIIKKAKEEFPSVAKPFWTAYKDLVDNELVPQLTDLHKHMLSRLPQFEVDSPATAAMHDLIELASIMTDAIDVNDNGNMFLHDTTYLGEHFMVKAWGDTARVYLNDDWPHHHYRFGDSNDKDIGRNFSVSLDFATGEDGDAMFEAFNHLRDAYTFFRDKQAQEESEAEEKEEEKASKKGNKKSLPKDKQSNSGEPNTKTPKNVIDENKELGDLFDEFDSLMNDNDLPENLFDLTGEPIPKAEENRKRLIQKLRELRKEIYSGDIESPVEVMQALDAILYQNKEENADKKYRPLIRGAEQVVSRILTAKRKGDIPTDTADFAVWLLNKNPQLANDLAISILLPRKSTNIHGQYYPLQRLIKIFKGGIADETIVHEILHHAERLLPDDMRKAISNEWARALDAEIKKASPERKQALLDLMAMTVLKDSDSQAKVKQAIANDLLTPSDYQFSNPSEYWAVNGSEFLNRNYETNSIWQKIKNWFSDLLEAAKKFFGLQNKDAVIKGLKEILESDGVRKNSQGIVDEYLRNKFNSGFEASRDLSTDPKLISTAIKIVDKFGQLKIHKLDEIAKQIYKKFGEDKLRDYFSYIKNAYSSAYNEAADDIADLMTDPKEVRKFDLEKLITDTKQEEAKAAEEARKTPENFVGKIKEDIAAGIQHNKASLEKLGREYGLTDATKIKELAELAVVERGREIASQPKVPEKEKYEQLITLYDNQPNLTHRSSESVEKQQYSTPVPYAYMAGVFAGLDKGAWTLESSAGNGMLTIAAPDPSKITVNEIDPTRLENLDKQGFFNVWNEDATRPFRYHNGVFEAAIANPPFGTLDKPVVKDGFEIRKLEHQILINNLDAMKDDGKASFIIGGHNEYDDKGRFTKDRVFFNWLYKHYNVKGVINVDGSLYKKQGTTFPTRLILIDGRKVTPEGIPPVQSKEGNKEVKTWDDLYNRVKQVQNNVSYENILQPGVDAGTESSGITRSGNEQPDNISGGTETVPTSKGNKTGAGINKPKGKSGQPGTGQIGERPGDRTGEPAGHSEGGTGKRPVSNGTGSTKGADRGESSAGTSVKPTAGSESTRGNDALNTLRESTNELLLNKTGNIPYTPTSKGQSLNTVVPASMAYHTLKTLEKIGKQHGDIDEWITKQLGYKDQKELFSKLSAEQIDAVAIAIYNIEKGQGAIIGDQTGIGKGRIAASIIRYAARSGRTPIFLTEKPTLFSDLYRDLSAIGSADLNPFIINGDGSKSNITDASGKVIYRTLPDAPKNSILNSGQVPSNYDYVLATYSQFNSEKRPLKRNYLMNIANGAVFILDESHNAGGDSNVGDFLQNRLAQSHGVTYLSATFAKRPDNIPIYAMKTAMSEANKEKEELVEAIKKGGVALQEIVSTDLVASGQMIRRERSFDGVEFNYKTLEEQKVEHSKAADTITGVTRDIIDFQEKFIKPLIKKLDKIEAENGEQAGLTQGTNMAGVDNYPFASKTFNLIDQMLFSVKADEVANEAIAALERGEKPVIAFRSTMGSFLEDMGIAPGDVLHSTDFSATLLRGLDGVMKYTVTSPNGAKGEPRTISPNMLTPEGVEAYNDLRNRILKASSGLSISPIDVIIDKIEKAGYTVGEVTGRKLKLKFQPDGSALVESKRDKDSKKIFRGFNNLNAEGKPDYDVLMFNQSGSTGVSAHSSVDFSDQRVRSMIIHQPHLDINTMVQTLGRTFRTGQVVNPKYMFMSSAIPAENRLMMMLKKKLKSLSANTTSNQKGSDQMLEQDDFLNQYGDEVVLEYLIEHPDLNDMLMDPLKLKEKGEDEIAEMSAPENAAMKVTGRVAIMPTEVQENFYNEIMRRYKDYIDYLNQTDGNDLEVQSLPLEAQTIGSQVVVEGKGGDSPFGTDSVLEKAEVNILKKPYTKAHVEKLLKEQLDGQTPEKQQKEIQKEVIDAVDKKYETDKEKGIQVNAEKLERALAHAEDEQDAEEIKANFERALEEKLRLMDYKYNNQRNYLNNILGEFKPGKVVMVPVSEKNLMFGSSPGIVIGFTINKKISNPYAPSAIKLKVAIGDARQMANIPLSRTNMLNGIVSASHLNNLSQSLLEHWDSMQSKKSRGERYIITGNILQAFGKPEYDGGKLIAYTTKDGDLKKGILLPEMFAQNVNTTNPTVVRPILNMLPQILNLHEHQFIKTTKDEMTIRMENGEYRIEVPRSKKQGGDVYLDADIRDLVQGRNFNSYGNNMVAYVDRENIEQFVRTVQRKFSFSVNAINEKSIDQQIRDQKKRIDDAESDMSDGGPTVSMNPIPTRKQARLLYEYGKLAWLYLKKGMSSAADFLLNVNERFSEYAVKAWNQAKSEFDAERIARKLERLKIGNNLFSIMPPFNLFPAIWNGSITIIQNEILKHPVPARTNAEVERAIDKGLTHAKSELAANGVTMTAKEEDIFKTRMRRGFVPMSPTPSFGNPINPPTAEEIKLSNEKFKQALTPEKEKSKFVSNTIDFFKNISKHIDNPFIYVSNIEKELFKKYPNASRLSKVPIGRLFEQSFTGPAKLAVENFKSEVLDGLTEKELDAFNEYLLARRVIDRLSKDPDGRATGNISVADALNKLSSLEKELGQTSYDKIVERGEKFQEHMDEVLLTLVEGGLISQKTYEKIKADNEFYAPFNVVQTLFNEIAKEAETKQGTGGSVLFKIQGISKKKHELTLSDLKKLQKAVDDKVISSEEFYRGAMEILQDMVDSKTITEEQYMQEVSRLADPGFKLTNIIDKAAEIIYKSRVVSERNKLFLKLDAMREVDEDQHFFKNVDGHDVRYDSDGNAYSVPKPLDEIRAPEGFSVIKYKKDGETKFVAVDTEAAKALRRMNDFEINMMMSFINWFNKLARFGIITYSPSFLYANSIIDNYRALTMSNYGAFAGKNMADVALNTLVLVPQMAEALISGLAANFTGKRTPLYESWMKSKSFNRGIFDDIFSNPNHKITAEINKTPGQKIIAALKYIINAVPALGTSLEQMPKLYTYARGMDVEGVERIGLTKFVKETLLRLDELNGKEGLELAAALDEVNYDVLNKAGSPNFSAAGNWAKYMSGVFQFFSARLKGEFTDWRILLNTEGGLLDKKPTAKNFARAAFKLAAYAIIPMLIAAIRNMWDDEDEKSFNTVTDWDKNNNMMFKTGESFQFTGDVESGMGQDFIYDDYVKIPLRGVPATANTFVNGFVQYLKHNDPETFKNAGKQLLTNATPLNLNFQFKENDPFTEKVRKVSQSVFSNMNPVLKYGYEELSGKNSWNDYDLMPDYRKYQRYLKGDEDVKPWDIKAYKGTKTADEISKFLYENMNGLQVTSAGIDHFMKVPLGNLYGIADTNTLSKRIFRSEEDYPVKQEKK